MHEVIEMLIGMEVRVLIIVIQWLGPEFFLPDSGIIERELATYVVFVIVFLDVLAIITEP
tara:strand:- start:77 stop:256 length:180 start_codon:yes stop_codon:yes gene_type:complete